MQNDTKLWDKLRAELLDVPHDTLFDVMDADRKLMSEVLLATPTEQLGTNHHMSLSWVFQDLVAILDNPEVSETLKKIKLPETAR